MANERERWLAEADADLETYPNAYPSGTSMDYYDEETAEEAVSCARRILQMSREL